ncbi:MAG: hypothetical protein COT90_03115 [Candidatus Diapherotrites archaeon CG10_big_fil_rev_8_21_14_0_10_31_34]|nr:MAG: hypothetical protein COT90_03115 [Candidatus Diapherotrites archaeon CG10_big_fil_rev_8_21_14_0_10_31_34]
MVVFSAVIDITLLAILVGVISQALQRKLMDKKAQKAKQDGMKEKQKKLKELMSKGDEQSKKEAEKLNMELMHDMKEMFKGMQKFMIASFIVIIPIFYLFVSAYKEETFNVFGWIVPQFFFPPHIVWYIISSIGFSIVFNLIMKAVEKSEMK